jgi:DNA-binding helix-hairpin-helix protein with protein kinase domain
MTEIFDRSGRLVRLGGEIGRGGEGSVFEVASNSRLAAKLYHQSMSPEQITKIDWMTSNPKTRKLLAWPTDLLVDRNGTPVGFLMPRFDGCRDIHQLYTPSSRVYYFPNADWRFQLQVAANAARAVATVHESGCVIGDLNHGSVLVANDATVRLIDCDSFQLVGKGCLFPCRVGVPEFTPPELTDKPLSNFVRTCDHDNFALAVLIFLLLFMGRHPWAHVDTIASTGATLPANAEGFAPPLASVPGTVPLDTVGPVSELFAAGLGIGPRPTAREWTAAIAKLSGQSAQCRSTRTHWHPGFLGSCPWCDIERASGVSFFVYVRRDEGNHVQIEQLWQELSKIPHPGPLPVLAAPIVAPSAEALRLQRRQRVRIILGPIAALAFATVAAFLLPKLLIIPAAAAGYFMVRVLFPVRQSLAELTLRRDNALRRARELEKMWSAQAGSRAFEQKRGEIEKLKRQIEALPATRGARLQKLRATSRSVKLERFLEGKRIADTTIPGLGRLRCHELTIHGIEAASHISLLRLEPVRGIGRKLASELLTWRRSVEAQFIYQPCSATVVRHEARVDRELATERQRLAQMASNSIKELRNAGDRLTAARSALRHRLVIARRNFAQATTDLNAATRVH